MRARGCAQHDERAAVLPLREARFCAHADYPRPEMFAMPRDADALMLVCARRV